MFRALLVLSLASAASGAANPMQAALAATLEHLDTNKNGKLEVSEFMANTFQPYDADKDRKITRAEFLAGWLQAYPDQREAGASIFDQVDEHGDKLWTMEDLMIAYRKMDANDNDVVSKDEFIAYSSAVLAKANFVLRGPIVG